MGAGLINANCLDGYINSAWSAYAGRTLTVVPRANEPNRRFFGRTLGSTMVFTDAGGAQVATVATPIRSNVWGGVFNAPNTPPFIEPEIKRTLCAALNRGTFGSSWAEQQVYGCRRRIHRRRCGNPDRQMRREPAQQFALSGAGDLVNLQANKCVDFKDWILDNDVMVELWTCSGGAN